MSESGIETYPVGLYSDLKRGRVWRGGRFYLWRQAKRGNWRAVRSYFNGYLAEWHYPPTDDAFRHPRMCGRGWTRKAALRDLGQKIVSANLHQREASRGERR